jgi:hypothetical protein
VRRAIAVNIERDLVQYLTGSVAAASAYRFNQIDQIAQARRATGEPLVNNLT